MKKHIKFFLAALPLTVGVTLTLIGLCFLVEFFDRGLRLDKEDFWTFVAFFSIGFPVMLFGANYLSESD